MAVSTSIFDNFLYNALHAKNIDLDSDTIKISLHTSTMAPNKATWDFADDLTNEVANGNGYTTGGATLASVALTKVPSASAPEAAVSTAYTLGQIVAKVADNGHIYRCIVAGTSHSTAPTWPTNPGETVTDGTVTWAECGSSYITLSFTAPTWTSSTITARYAVIYDSTPGSAGTNPLIAYIDFGADVATTNGTFTITPDATYGLVQILNL